MFQFICFFILYCLKSFNLVIIGSFSCFYYIYVGGRDLKVNTRVVKRNCYIKEKLNNHVEWSVVDSLRSLTA